jgi:hypothetical protein
MKRESQIAATGFLFAYAAFAQVLPDSSPSRRVWQPPTLQVPDALPRPTVPKEMVTTLRVAGMPIVLEKTGLAEVQNRFGGSIGRRGDASESLAWLCFQGADTDQRWALWLESGELGGLTVIDGYAMQRLDPNAVVDQRCREIGKSAGGIELPVAIRLGVTEMQVSKVLGKPTARYGNTLLFEHLHEETIHGEPYTVSNTVYITLRGGIVWGIQVWKDTAS